MGLAVLQVYVTNAKQLQIAAAYTKQRSIRINLPNCPE
jgi:hypothetical protein